MMACRGKATDRVPLTKKALAVLDSAKEPLSYIALGQDIGCSERVATRVVQELRSRGYDVRRVTGYTLQKQPE